MFIYLLSRTDLTASQNVAWHIGHVLFWPELNHLYRQAAWNFLAHVRHSSFGSWRVAGWTIT